MKRLIPIFVCVVFAGCAKDVDRTLGKLEVCPVHHVKMEKRRVEIEYGYEQPSPSYVKLWSPVWAEYAKLEPSLFPFGQTGFHVATATDWRSPRHALIYVCPMCAPAAAKWWKENKPNQ